MIRKLKTRDRKESELSAIRFRISKADETKVQEQDSFKRKLEDYQIWKKENSIEGIIY